MACPYDSFEDLGIGPESLFGREVGSQIFRSGRRRDGAATAPSFSLSHQALVSAFAAFPNPGTMLSERRFTDSSPMAVASHGAPVYRHQQLGGATGNTFPTAIYSWLAEQATG